MKRLIEVERIRRREVGNGGLGDSFEVYYTQNISYIALKSKMKKDF